MPSENSSLTDGIFLFYPDRYKCSPKQIHDYYNLPTLRLLGGAVIRAGVGAQARADAKIILEGIKSSVHTETVSNSKSALWQKQAGRGSTVETLNHLVHAKPNIIIHLIKCPCITPCRFNSMSIFSGKHIRHRLIAWVSVIARVINHHAISTPLNRLTRKCFIGCYTTVRQSQLRKMTAICIN